MRYVDPHARLPRWLYQITARRVDLVRRRWQLRFSRAKVVRRPPPLAGEDVCLLATFSANHRVDEHTLVLMRAWKAAGFKVVLVVAMAAFDRGDVEAFVAPSDVDGLILRENCGYDFGSWSVALRELGDCRKAKLLAIANDSVYGPLKSLADIVRAVREADADVVGMTDSYEVRHHFQSYLVFYQPAALESAAFSRFWRRRAAGNRDDAIEEAELCQMEELMAGGLRTHALFAQDPANPLNPTLFDWQRLIAAGFPFLKISLFKDQRFAGGVMAARTLLRSYDYDFGIVERHLGLAANAISGFDAGG